jgi:Zn-finger nucleic acid-binding protein
MGEVAKDIRKEGYSKEDEYFYKKDQELLARLRKEAEERRAKQEAENEKKQYWMRCPKCGSDLKEESYGGIVTVDRCTQAECAGIFFDGGELEMLLKAKGSLFRRILGG